MANANHNGAKCDESHRSAFTNNQRSFVCIQLQPQPINKWVRETNEQRTHGLEPNVKFSMICVRWWWQSFNRQWHSSSATVNAHSSRLACTPHRIRFDEGNDGKNKMWNVCCNTRQLQSLIYYKPICARFKSARDCNCNLICETNWKRCDWHDTIRSNTDPNANTFMKRSFHCETFFFLLFFFFLRKCKYNFSPSSSMQKENDFPHCRCKAEIGPIKISNRN